MNSTLQLKCIKSKLLSPSAYKSLSVRTVVCVRARARACVRVCVSVTCWRIFFLLQIQNSNYL